MLMKPFSVMPVMPGYRVSSVRPNIRSGRPAAIGFRRAKARSSIGQDVVLDRLLEEQRLHLLDLVGVLVGEVVGEAEVLVHVVELPAVVVEALGSRDLRPGFAVDDGGEPAVVVDAAVAGALVVLGDVPVGGGAVVERVADAHAGHRRLLVAVDDLRLGHADGVEDRRHDVDEVVVLVAQLALGLDSLRPVHGHPGHVAAAVGHLDAPGRRRRRRRRPSRRSSSGRSSRRRTRPGG